MFDKLESNDTGGLFWALSGTPSLCKGIFQLSRYVDVIKEQFMISVRESIIISRVSLKHCTLNLSGPGALLDEDLKIILRTSPRN
jgi:hypothetical protein